MKAASDDILLAMRVPNEHGLNTTITWSFVVHALAAVALFVVPRDWLSKPIEKEMLVSISLGGTPGPNTTGMTPLAGRTVEQVAPTPPRPEPIKPIDTKPESVPSPTRVVAPSRRPVNADPMPTAPPVPSAPPVTAPELSKGASKVETGSRTEGTGLSAGGGIAGERMSIAPDFCCMAYANTVFGLIDTAWGADRNLPDRGTAVVRFEIRKDGLIENVTIQTPSGSSLLDRASQRALYSVAKVPALPPEYKGDRLVVLLKFPYGVK